MANYCNFCCKVIGQRKNIRYLRKYALAEYAYGDDKITNNKFNEEEIEHHFFRVFDFSTNDDVLTSGDPDEIIEVYFTGYCAWSVYSCMCKGKNTYYNDFKKVYGKNSRGITLQDACKKLHLKCEIISEESGCCFWEHYAYDENGNSLVENSKNSGDLYILDQETYDTYEDFKKENPKSTISKEDYDEGWNIYEAINCNCIDKYGEYIFNIF